MRRILEVYDKIVWTVIKGLAMSDCASLAGMSGRLSDWVWCGPTRADARWRDPACHVYLGTFRYCTICLFSLHLDGETAQIGQRDGSCLKAVRLAITYLPT